MISPLINFTSSDIAEFLTVCTDSYVSTNPFLILKIQTPEEFQKETEQMVKMFIEGAEIINKKFNTNVLFNAYLRMDGAMVRAGFSCELYYYMNVVCKNQKDEFFEELCKMDLSQIQEGTAVVSIREVTNKNYYRRGLMKYGLIERSKHLVSQGYFYDFIWTSNPVAHKVNVQLGGEVLKTMDAKLNEVDIKIYLIKRDMRITANMKASIT